VSDISLIKKQLQQSTALANKAVSDRLPLSDTDDFDAAKRGHIASLPSGGVLTADGRKVWDIGDYDFLDQPCPASVNPSLWRMAQLNKISGLFEVTEGVWQARACDYANMTVISGQNGWILVDPLMARESAAAALKMINQTLGERPVSAVLITHTHPDHFGGIKGVLGDDSDNYPPVYAPAEFMTYAASEGMLGGNHTSRRAIYQFGIGLAAGAEGLVDGGIGKTVAKGQRTFVEPSHYIEKTGEEHVIDGVLFVFQMASGTEAPAEFIFMLPDHGVLCMAEVCTQTMHNVLTPRGAQIRDALLWSRTIDEAKVRFAANADILINCHNWPVWGKQQVETYLEEQRDIYKYIHDQTLRLANHGHTPNEIAELVSEPEWLSQKFHARGYYGSLKFNTRAVYQFYYGFFDGQPVNLDPLPPEQLGKHFVEAIGGFEAVLEKAHQAIENDQLQWAATLLNHAVFARPEQEHDTNIRAVLAEIYRHQGFREESSVMRNFYLSGAMELEQGVKPLPMAGGRNEDLAATLNLQDWFDAYAVRLNPTRAAAHSLTINIEVDGKSACVCVTRQTEFMRSDHSSPAADATLVISQPSLEGLTAGHVSLHQAIESGATVSGEQSQLQLWLDMHDAFDLWFDIVTP